MINVLLVDDHTVVRDGLRMLLERTTDIRIQAEAANVTDALHLVKTAPIDIVLLDLALPDKTGMDAIPEIQRIKPGLPVLIFSGFSEDTYAVSCLRAGAMGYLSKESDPETIRSALRIAAKKERYISSRVAARLLNDAISPPPPPKPTQKKLSAREFDIMIRISRGEGLTHIGNQLCLSNKTISAHRANILEKLGLTNNADIVKHVISQNLDNIAQDVNPLSTF
jgi:DNA-binding NarL/FixJ family response regulator